MTGMGTFLATVALVVPLMTWLRGMLLSTPQFRLARIASAPRDKCPHSRNPILPVPQTWPGRTR
jgi:hypothetical protein